MQTVFSYTFRNRVVAELDFIFPVSLVIPYENVLIIDVCHYRRVGIVVDADLVISLYRECESFIYKSVFALYPVFDICTVISLALLFIPERDASVSVLIKSVCLSEFGKVSRHGCACRHGFQAFSSYGEFEDITGLECLRIQYQSVIRDFRRVYIDFLAIASQ